jgi:Icc-related predicted phosphoesterase
MARARVRRILCVADPRGAVDALARVLAVAGERGADAVAVVGDLRGARSTPDDYRAVFRMLGDADLPA